VSLIALINNYNRMNVITQQRLPPGRPRIPMLLSLRASRPGQPSRIQSTSGREDHSSIGARAVTEFDRLDGATPN
jgi:hypothetical protein